MRKRVIVMILSACLLLAAGCSETEPPMDISESGENPIPPTASSTDDSEPSENLPALPAFNTDDSLNNTVEEESEIGQEQLLPEISVADSRPIISASVFLGADVNLGDFTHLEINRRHSPFYRLHYHDAKEFLSGIDFSQLEPLDGNYEEFYLGFGGYDILGSWSGIEGHVHHNLRFRLPLHRLAYGLAIHSINETYRINPHEFRFSTTHYFYSISPEFYFDMRERIEEFSQYARWPGLPIPFPEPPPIINSSTFFEGFDRLNINFPDGTAIGDDFISRELRLPYDENVEEVEEFISSIDFSQLEPIDENDERYNLDVLLNLAMSSAAGIRISAWDGSLWLNMRWGYGDEGVAVFRVRGAQSFYSITQEFYDAVFNRIEEFYQARWDAQN